jgi:hypothetical protein
LANANPDNKAKVRKKLRTPAQLLAQSSAGHGQRGLKRINHTNFNHRVRNFLRIMALQH